MTETIELELTGLTPSGEAIGVHPQTGRQVWVADAIPGERVEVILDRKQRARLLRVLEASPDRVTPPCPYFGPPQPVTLPDGSQLNPDGAPRCAGCLWQHIAYDRQLALKREIVLQALAPLPDLGVDSNGRPYRPERLLAEVIALGDPEAEEDAALDYHYLTQMTFALDAEGRLCLSTRPTLGMPSLLPIDFCLLHHPQLADLFAAFAVDEETGRELAQELLSVEMSVGATADTVEDEAKGVLVLETRSGEAPSLELGLPVNVLVRGPGTHEVAAVDLVVGDWSFPVALGEERLLGYPPMGGTPLISPHAHGDEAIGTLVASVLELQPFEHGIHLWAGAGLVSRMVARQVSTLIAIEENELAVAALQANTAGTDNVDIHSGPVPRILDNLRRGGYETNVALLTPRDEVVNETILRHLNTLGIVRFALVCEDPAEIVRLVPLAQAERYELINIQPVDLQPQQEGVLLIVRFDRRR